MVVVTIWKKQHATPILKYTFRGIVKRITLWVVENQLYIGNQGKGWKQQMENTSHTATVLEHEFDHAVDNYRNHRNHLQRSNEYDKQYDNKEERRVITGSETKSDTTYKSAWFGNCTYAFILDKHHPKKDKNTFPVVMRYTIDRKSWYNFVAGEFTEEDFAKVCNLSAKAVRSELYEKKLEFDAIF